LRNTPTPATLTSTVSPAASGPTPAGVPVAMTSPGNQGHHAGNPADQERSRIKSSMKSYPMPAFAVDVSLYEHIRWIKRSFDMRADRTKSVESLCASELHVALLQVRAQLHH